MGVGKKSIRSYNHVSTVYKVTNVGKIYKKLKIFRQHFLCHLTYLTLSRHKHFSI